MWPALAYLVAPALLLPIGQSYATRLRLPLLGSQTVRLSVLNETHARVRLSGLLRTEGLVAYSHTPGRGFAFELDDALSAVVSKYGCSLSHADFDFARDEAHLTLHIRPLFLRKQLRLKRVEPDEREARAQERVRPDCFNGMLG
jgi:hypothetical protein